MNQIQLNVDEMKAFIKHMVKNNQHIQQDGKVPVAINVEGEAGLGKTSAIMQLGSIPGQYAGQSLNFANQRAGSAFNAAQMRSGAALGRAGAMTGMIGSALEGFNTQKYKKYSLDELKALGVGLMQTQGPGYGGKP